MLQGWGGRGRGDRRCWPTRGPPPTPALGPWSQFLPRRPSQATSARPNHETRRDAFTVRSDRRRALRVSVGHADEHLDQTGGAELPPRGARDRDAVDADAAPRPPAKAVLKFPQKPLPGAEIHKKLPQRETPLCPSIARSRSRVKYTYVNSGRNSRRLRLRTDDEQ